jgi:hypothetical protein
VFISEYTNQLVYVPSTSNVVANPLSRPAAAAAGTARVCAAIANRAPLDLKDMALRQVLCPQVQAFRSSPGLRIITQKVGVLDLIGDSSTGTFRPLVPETFGDRFLNIFTGRSPRQAGNPPPYLLQVGMFGRVSTDFTAWAKACLDCQQAKIHLHIQVLPQHITVPTCCFSHIHVDLVGPLPASKGYTYLFTIMDRTSRWPEAIPIAAISTVDCANALFQGWVSRFGVPAVITSGLGTQFTSSPWAAPCSLLNIQHSQTTRSLTGWWNVSIAASKMHSAPAAPQRTGWTTFHGSSWAYVQQPGKMTTPPPLRQCSAHHSFYMVNFWIYLNYLPKIFLNNSLRH